jgi:Flp pilus assembly protein TadD
MTEPAADKRTKEDLDREVFNAFEKHKSGKGEDAVGLIQRSLEIKPENPDALNHLGQAYIRLDDYLTADQSFRQALVYDSNHFHAINNLATVSDMPAISKRR